MAIKHKFEAKREDLITSKDWNAEHIIENGTIKALHIDVEQIITDHIVDNAITTSKIANNSITKNKIKNKAITAEKLDAVNDAEDGYVVSYDANSEKFRWKYIEEGVKKHTQLQDKEVNGVIDHADNSITTDKIRNNAITTEKIIDEAITTEKIQNSAITTEKIKDNAITTDKIQNNAISTDKIQNNAITTEKIIDNAITTSKIQNSAITTEKIDAVNSPSDNFVVSYDQATTKFKYVDPETFKPPKHFISVSFKPRPHGITEYQVPYAVGATAATTLTLTASRVYWIPFFVSRKVSITTLAANVTTAASGTHYIGIYASDSLWRPTGNTLVSFSFDAGSTGLKTTTVNITLSEGLYWLAWASGSAATVRAIALASCLSLGLSGLGTANTTAFYTSGSTLPNPAPATGYTALTGSALPAVGFAFSFV